MGMQGMLLGTLAAALFVATGCSNESATSDPVASGGASQYLLADEPADGKDVKQARTEAKDNEPVVVVGRIGGSHEPWVEGTAAFTIVDRSLKACSDIEGDACPTPWDYCCETPNLKDATALVKVVDDSGNLVKTDARELLDVKELATVVVRGTASRDEAGNLTILADGVHVRP